MIPKGIYQHYKGNLYNVIATARHSESKEIYVVYYPNGQPENVWIRPLSMFIENVMVEEQTISRFKKI